MRSPAGWQNPIVAQPGQSQVNIDPALLLPSRSDLLRTRLEFQRGLLKSGTPRYTPISVTRDGVVCDGRHAVRAAAEEGLLVTVQVIGLPIAWSGILIHALLVR